LYQQPSELAQWKVETCAFVPSRSLYSCPLFLITFFNTLRASLRCMFSQHTARRFVRRPLRSCYERRRPPNSDLHHGKTESIASSVKLHVWPHVPRYVVDPAGAFGDGGGGGVGGGRHSGGRGSHGARADREEQPHERPEEVPAAAKNRASRLCSTAPVVDGRPSIVSKHEID
jgi:hypothetical protein